VNHRKRASKLSSITSPNVNRFWKFFHWRTLQTTCDTTIVQDFTTLRYITLIVKYKFSKSAPTEAQQRQNKRSWTKENLIMVNETVRSQADQPQIYRSVHQIAKAGVIRITFHGDLELMRLKRRVVKNWEANFYSRNSFLKLFWLMTLKMWLMVSGAANNNKI